MRNRAGMKRVVLSGVGVEIPEASISNEELVDSFNVWVDRENATRCLNGAPLLQKSDSDFIVYASGVRNRHVLVRDGILDPDRMTPRIAPRPDDQLSVMAEFGVASARKALADAGREAADIDLVICASSHQQRPYPAIAIEIQNELGTRGAAFDMNLGCSSAGAAIHIAHNLVRAGGHRRVLVVSPEIITGQLNFRDRQTHFIFGDASASVLVEAMEEGSKPKGAFEILASDTWTQFSNNIRTNFGFLVRAGQEDVSVVDMEGNMITQVGNKVFKEVTVAAHRFITDFLARQDLTSAQMRRFWLHQANARMNAMILKLSLGHEADHDRAPMVLDRLGNTAAAGAIIALEENRRDLSAGDYGLFCAFGAGYSIGAALLKKL